jgi:DNA-binding NarL/FixJ family response regulator
MVSILERQSETARGLIDGAGDESLRRSLRVLIVEPQPLLRLGLRVTLQRDPSIIVLADVASLDELQQTAGGRGPEIVLVGTDAAGEDGVEVMKLVRQVERLFPTARVVLLSRKLDDSDARRALRAGVWGYLPVTIAPHALVAGLKTVRDGEVALPKALVRRLVQGLAPASAAS